MCQITILQKLLDNLPNLPNAGSNPKQDVFNFGVDANPEIEREAQLVPVCSRVCEHKWEGSTGLFLQSFFF